MKNTIATLALTAIMAVSAFANGGIIVSDLGETTEPCKEGIIVSDIVGIIVSDFTGIIVSDLKDSETCGIIVSDLDGGGIIVSD